MNAPVDYWDHFVDQPDAYFDAINQHPGWSRHTARGTPIPRDELYFNDSPATYAYGSGENVRTYEPEGGWDPWVMSIRLRLELVVGDGPFDVCFLNRYHGPRDQLGWHADDSPEMDQTLGIATVSLGAVRDIQFRESPGLFTKGSTIPVETLSLASGSCAYMRPGMQNGWQHRIPKSSRSDIGTRISLTFRRYLAPPSPGTGEGAGS